MDINGHDDMCECGHDQVVAKERGTVKPYKTLFDFGSETNAKHVWSSAVEHMVFFT